MKEMDTLNVLPFKAITLIMETSRSVKIIFIFQTSALCQYKYRLPYYANFNYIYLIKAGFVVR